MRKILKKRAALLRIWKRAFTRKLVGKGLFVVKPQKSISAAGFSLYLIIFAYLSFLKRTNQLNQTVNLYE